MDIYLCSWLLCRFLVDENKNKGPTDTSFMLRVTFYDADKYK